MAKRFLEDMVKIKRASKSAPFEGSPPVSFSKAESVREIKKEVQHRPAPKRSRFLLWIVAFVSVTFFIFALAYLFTKAEVQVEPKTTEVSLNEKFSAGKDSDVAGLSFDLVVISGGVNKVVPASGETEVKKPAVGTVIIYNAWSAESQRLDQDTRLEGSNGKIYKTQSKISVPGQSRNGIPGSVEVKIYGSEEGESYNSLPLDFKIFGFKGTPKYAKFYGRSKGEIAGGFIGKAPVVSEGDKQTALLSLKEELRTKLLKRATGEMPAGFVLFKDAIFLKTGESKVSFTQNKEGADISLQGTLYGIIFEGQKLAKKIAETKLEKYDGNEIFISNIEDLSFSLPMLSGGGGGDPVLDTVKTIDFNLSGRARLAWKIDVAKFTADLLGLPKSDFTSLLAAYPNINSATLTLSPFWRTSIPEDREDVKIMVNYPK